MGNEKQATENDPKTAKAAKKGKAAPKAAGAPNDDIDYGELDKVRSILFGAQSRQHQQRLEWMEDHFGRESEALKEALEDQIAALGKKVKKEDEALSKRLSTEQQQRAEADAALDEALQALAQSLQENRAQLDLKIAETESALRKALRDEAKKAEKDRAARFDELSARLEQAVAQLSDAKTDRVGLADLFDALSAQLRDGQPASEET